MLSNINLEATFESYEDKKFEQLMVLDGLSPADLMSSLSIEENRNMVFKAGEGAGKSGSFFFFSHDNRFLIKTLKGDEKQVLLNLLDDYITHILKSDNQSLLARIYGLFTIKTNYFAPLDILIMQNTALLQNKYNPRVTFDLKGSSTNRCNLAASKSKFWRHQMNYPKVLKDLNFLEIQKEEVLLSLEKARAKQLAHQIESDSQLLRKHGLMDYSLLLILEQVDSLNSHPSRNLIQIDRDGKRYNYHLGIIDYLQDFIHKIGLKIFFGLFAAKKIGDYFKDLPASQKTREYLFGKPHSLLKEIFKIYE
jgi:hypothetical protein